MIINLKTECGKNTVTRADGEVINTKIINQWDTNERIQIDFSNILIASVSFLDEAFGKLAFEYSKEKLKEKLEFINIEKYDRALLNDILVSRYHQKDLGKNGLSKK